MTLETRETITLSVPENAFAGDEPLVAVMRGEHIGSLHRGTFALVSREGETRLALGDIAQPVYLRSAAKPFQAMPAVLAGAVERFGLTERELAVLCASHSGEDRHMEAVLAALAKMGLDESALQCGIHPPLHEPTAHRRWAAGQEPTPVCNNCSGAHAGMLAACRARDWPVESYTATDHPLQVQIRSILAGFAGLEVAEVTYATDNCHVPTFRLPVRAAALAFARLARPAGLQPELEEAAGRIVRAMTSHPEMVAGEDRFDTDLMTSARGAVVAKGGAEGFQGIGVLERGLGLAIKVTDGNARALPPSALAILDQLGVLDGTSDLDGYRRPAVHDRRGEVVGSLVPAFRIEAD